MEIMSAKMAEPIGGAASTANPTSSSPGRLSDPRYLAAVT
jgi:hypothetical protein